MPAPRTPAQIEAARRSGAKSRRPVSEEGKARSSMNALRHGLASAGDVLLEGEDRDAYEELLANLVEEMALATELEAQLVRRLASTLWKQHRADRLEAKLFAWTDTPKVFHAGKYLPLDAEAGFDLARFAAVQRYQAQLAREVTRLLRELRRLKAEPIAEPRNEPEPVAVPEQTSLRNEPEPTAAQPAIRIPGRPSPVTSGGTPAGAARPPANDEGRATPAALTCGSASRTPPPSPPP